MFPMQTRERLKSDEEIVKNGGIGIHCSIEKSDFDIVGIYFIQSHLQLLEFLLIKFTSWQTEIS